MRFGETPIDEATGAILAHSWRASGVNFSKGRLLSADDVAKLKAAGAATVIAARLDADDVHEDEAASAVAKALAGQGIEITLHADCRFQFADSIVDFRSNLQSAI